MIKSFVSYVIIICFKYLDRSIDFFPIQGPHCIEGQAKLYNILPFFHFLGSNPLLFLIILVLCTLQSEKVSHVFDIYAIFLIVCWFHTIVKFTYEREDIYIRCIR